MKIGYAALAALLALPALASAKDAARQRDFSTLRSQHVSNPDRMFVADLSGNGQSDAVFFNADKSVLGVCLDGKTERCRAYELADTADVVPAAPRRGAVGQHALLVIGKTGTTQLCELSASLQLQCADVGADARVVFVETPTGQRFASTHAAGEDYSCAFTDSGASRCSSARSMVSADKALLFARFAKNRDAELLTFRDGVAQLCAISGRCTPVTGLERFATRNPQVAALWSGKHAASLVGVFDQEVAYCQLTGQARFECAYEGTLLKARSMQISVVMVRNSAGKPVVEWLSVRPTMETLKQATIIGTVVQVTGYQEEVSDSLKRARRNLAQRGHDHVSSAVEHSDFDRYRTLASHILVDDDFSMTFGSPALYLMWDNFDNSFSMWSDMVGINLLYAFAVTQPRQVCLDSCDASKDADAGMCAIFAGAIIVGGYLSTGALSLATLITGPGAGAVLITGLTVTTSVATGVGTVCAARTWANWAYCTSKC